MLSGRLPCPKTIGSLKAAFLDAFKADVWLLSPPCQARAWHRCAPLPTAVRQPLSQVSFFLDVSFSKQHAQPSCNDLRPSASSLLLFESDCSRSPATASARTSATDERSPSCRSWTRSSSSRNPRLTSSLRMSSVRRRRGYAALRMQRPQWQLRRGTNTRRILRACVRSC